MAFDKKKWKFIEEEWKGKNYKVQVLSRKSPIVDSGREMMIEDYKIKSMKLEDERPKLYIRRTHAEQGVKIRDQLKANLKIRGVRSSVRG